MKKLNRSTVLDEQVNSFQKELFYVYLFKNFRFQHNIRPDVFHYYTTQEKIT